MAVTAETLVLAIILIAPGVIAVLIGMTIGVVEQNVSRDKLYLTSFASSLIINLIFVYILQNNYGKDISGRKAFEAVFFTQNGFNILPATILIILSIVVGIIYALTLTFDTAEYVRDILAKQTSHRRNPRQPWEGGLRNAKKVTVQLSSGDDVMGVLKEYSRLEKEKQLVLKYPQFHFQDEPNREKIIITEDQIDLVHVVSTRDREGLGSGIRSLANTIVEKVKYMFKIVYLTYDRKK
jgi:hypothetical protein